MRNVRLTQFQVARPGSILLTVIALVICPNNRCVQTQIPSTDVSEAQGRELRMLSGWDNEDPDMQGIFMARGPGKRSEFEQFQFRIQPSNKTTSRRQSRRSTSSNCRSSCSDSAPRRRITAPGSTSRTCSQTSGSCPSRPTSRRPPRSLQYQSWLAACFFSASLSALSDSIRSLFFAVVCAVLSIH